MKLNTLNTEEKEILENSKKIILDELNKMYDPSYNDNIVAIGFTIVILVISAIFFFVFSKLFYFKSNDLESSLYCLLFGLLNSSVSFLLIRFSRKKWSNYLDCVEEKESELKLINDALKKL